LYAAQRFKIFVLGGNEKLFTPPYPFGQPLCHEMPPLATFFVAAFLNNSYRHSLAGHSKHTRDAMQSECQTSQGEGVCVCVWVFGMENPRFRILGMSFHMLLSCQIETHLWAIKTNTQKKCTAFCLDFEIVAQLY